MEGPGLESENPNIDEAKTEKWNIEMKNERKYLDNNIIKYFIYCPQCYLNKMTIRSFNNIKNK